MTRRFKAAGYHCAQSCFDTRQQLLQCVLGKAVQFQHAPPLLDHRPTAQARAQGARDPVLRSLSISMEEASRGKEVDLRGLLHGLQHHPRAMLLVRGVTELKLVGAVW